MSHHLKLRVHYPLDKVEGAVLRLRTDRDWDLDVAPTSVSADGTVHTFPFDFDHGQPFAYWKAVLRRGDETLWAVGEDELALADDKPERDVFPHFFGDTACSVCNLHHLRDETTEREHALRVFYPPGYEENTLASYPVLYMQDGQNLFFADEAFGGHHWMVDETLRVLNAMNLVQPAIVVGVYPNDRMADYTKPGYEAYGKFLVEIVKPWVDANYRTKTEAPNTAVMGSSLGGVVSFYLAWQWPEVFGHAACLSSTFGYQDDLHERVESEPQRKGKIYLDSGWPRDNYEATRAMRNSLRARGYRDGENLLYLAFPRATHNEQAWAMRAHIPFQFFFGG